MNGNAGHGFVKTSLSRRRQQATDAHALLQCTISSDDHPETLEGYPFPYRLTATYRLDARGLTLDVAVQNTGEGPLPFGFGAHPYFRIPIAPGGRREDCRVTVPAARRWNLGRIGALTLDAPLTRDDVTEPVGDAEDLRRPRPLEGRRYDGGFTDLVASGGWVECAVLDPAAGLALVMECSDSFGTVVVYTPAGRPGVCFEPWTCPPNAFNLLAAGVEDSGVVVLPPGESWRGTMRLSVRAMGQESPAPE